ncbi:hypothetical protein PDE_00235 [Penicillium oxalicum 114-2]|uniref:Uncharacterized protein n=1 Tax=Penicillium oxalicum (strain 114-2 / CGMCC 5302) TaxID=933388 RepID=S8AU04_PENO1|nr:hypothetical protein PDE_00235 [Penicillium oxalicum 114-2]
MDAHLTVVLAHGGTGLRIMHGWSSIITWASDAVFMIPTRPCPLDTSTRYGKRSCRAHRNWREPDIYIRRVSLSDVRLPSRAEVAQS